jgi:hypothetical protein
MAVKLAYQSEFQYANTKGIIFKATFTGNYGTNGVGDLLNLTPSQNGGADGGVTDPNSSYYLILEQPPSEYGVLNENLGGSYVAVNPNAKPSLTNFGLLMYEPGGTEKATAAAYTAAELAGVVFLIFFVPAQQ